MIVLLMRHAEREEHLTGVKERDLPLTARGVADAKTVARQLARKLPGCPPIDQVLSSPHRAAIETARRVLDILGAEALVTVQTTLDPDVSNPRDPRPLATIVDDLATQSELTILIVGHQPLLGELGKSWTGERVSPVRGGIACIDYSESMTRLLWMLEPVE